jgi:hypothetical protein
MLSNGSILVIGGEVGSNGAPQPNLEILPTPPGGNTVVELDWLARTDPFNLYPFVVVLPSKNIFVGALLFALRSPTCSSLYLHHDSLLQ